MLSVLLKRNYTEEMKKDLAALFIDFEKEAITMIDGFTYKCNKVTVGETPESQMTIVNIEVYFNNTNVCNTTFDLNYYSAMIVPILENSLGIMSKHKAAHLAGKCTCGENAPIAHKCSCGHSHDEEHKCECENCK